MSNSKKHILFLPRWYPHQQDPMFGLFVRKHAEAVAKYNQVTVLYIQGLGTDGKFEKKQLFIEKNLLTHIYYYRNSTSRVWNSLRFWYYLVIGFFRIQKKIGRPQLVHVHILTRLGIFALILKTLFNIPYVITEHWSRYLPIPGTYRGLIRKKLGQVVVKHAKAILPVSRNLAEAMQKHNLMNPNYQIIPNVVEDLFFQEPKEKESNDQITFIHISTFEDRSKNISGILRCIERVSKKYSNFRCWFVGDGIDFDFLKNYAQDLTIPKKQIRFYGLMQGQALVDLIQKADYLLLFSNYENIPVVINEAQACGLAVIASNVGGISEVINRENGFLIEAGKEEELESTLIHILTKRPTFNRLEIHQKAKDLYSYQSIGQQLNNIYSKFI